MVTGLTSWILDFDCLWESKLDFDSKSPILSFSIKQ